MTELFEAWPGTTIELGALRLDESRQRADDLLGDERFLTFGLHSADRPLPSRALGFIGGLGRLSLPLGEHWTVNTGGGDTRTVLGFDIVKGKPGSSRGTTYERPIAGNANPERSSVLANKLFAYLPLDEPIDITTGTGRTQAVKPGYAFLSMEGEAHTVHIPSDHVAVELILTENDTGLEDEWERYITSQPNPNM